MLGYMMVVRRSGYDMYSSALLGSCGELRLGCVPPEPSSSLWVDCVLQHS